MPDFGIRNLHSEVRILMIVIALLTLDIHIPHAHSLKDKRMIVRSLKDRLRAKFNVSVSEVDHQDLWQRSQVSVVTVGSDEAFLHKVLGEAAEEAERIAPDCMIQSNIEIV
jgi:uncharacterized protein YlxP (DUF503 family)